MSNFEVDFNCLYKNLVDAGFNVLTYDFRGHGESENPATGCIGNGYFEWQDAVAVQQFACKNKKIESVVNIAFCMGATATIKAMSKHPECFKTSKALFIGNPRNSSTYL